MPQVGSVTSTVLSCRKIGQALFSRVTFCNQESAQNFLKIGHENEPFVTLKDKNPRKSPGIHDLIIIQHISVNEFPGRSTEVIETSDPEAINANYNLNFAGFPSQFQTTKTHN